MDKLLTALRYAQTFLPLLVSFLETAHPAAKSAAGLVDKAQ